ncbi:hypothetical protein IQ07DRAFT_313517 [Pyrenochaeta sp. DS3sAY3a]|nr:hypothetical protein IQ07DRAFT_313517 [Pyrenochaeta sp. DS3sAY3a]
MKFIVTPKSSDCMSWQLSRRAACTVTGRGTTVKSLRCTQSTGPWRAPTDQPQFLLNPSPMLCIPVDYAYLRTTARSIALRGHPSAKAPGKSHTSAFPFFLFAHRSGCHSIPPVPLSSGYKCCSETHLMKELSMVASLHSPLHLLGHWHP